PADIVSVESVPDPPRPDAAASPSAPASLPQKPPSVTPAVLTPEDLNEMLVKAGNQHNLDRDLLASIVKAESNGNAHAVSGAGARRLQRRPGGGGQVPRHPALSRNPPLRGPRNPRVQPPRPGARSPGAQVAGSVRPGRIGSYSIGLRDQVRWKLIRRDSRRY